MEECLPFDPNPRAPSFAPPPGAWDTAVHVFGPADRYPAVATALYAPPVAPMAALQSLHSVLGIERGVIIQPSIYGADHSLLRELLTAGGGAYRGIAVLDDTVSDSELEDLDRAGVRGVRLNFAKFLGAVPERGSVDRLVARIAAFGWHAILHVEGHDLVEQEDYFRRFPVPVVIDHMAHLDCRAGIDQKPLRLMIDMMQSGNCWVKIANGDRMSHQGPPYADTVAIAQAIIDAGPDRVIWASDWPHVYYLKPEMANDGELMDLLGVYAPDPAVRDRILVDNPRMLYDGD